MCAKEEFRKRTRRERRKKLMALLAGAGATDVAGVQEIYKEMVGTVLENGLKGELDEQLGYPSTTTGTRVSVH